MLQSFNIDDIAVEETMLKALIFDFDGLIIDTETPDYQAWSEIYISYGATLSRAKWMSHVGAWGTFNPYAYLEEQVGRELDRVKIREKRRARYEELVANQPILPGVVDMLTSAKAKGLKLGVASNSFNKWVVRHLKNRDLYHYFDTVMTLDQITIGKPEPKMYLTALHWLGVMANEAIAFEDSPTGAMGAKRAGIYTIVIPNNMTRGENFSHVDRVITSMTDLNLDTLCEEFDNVST